jgi:cyclopropane-fatty-acyl-phospholipid synthase
VRLLSGLLNKFIRNGTLRLYDAAGTLHVFGGRAPGPDVTARLNRPGLETKLFLNPELNAGEAYMDGGLTFENGATIHDMLMLFSVNRAGLGAHGSQKLIRRLWRALRRWHQSNPVGTAAKNARQHYDVPAELYRLFLDEKMQYSCAYFRDPEHDTLEQAQNYKLIHATSKLNLKPGMSAIEIGSGWGGFAIHIAQQTGARVVAINVSPEQLKVSRDNAAAAGVSGLVEFREIDYRNVEGQFDRVVSVGMMEHVGIGHFDEYFGKIRSLLKDDGYAFIHCIGRMSPPGTTGPFIRKYIFPGGYSPALSSATACGTPTPNSCGCIITTPSAIGGSASRRTATRLCRSWTSGFAGCGSSILPPSSWNSCTARTWSCKCCCRKRATPCRSGGISWSTPNARRGRHEHIPSR